MDSLGTITQHFPFLDEDIRSVLETIMEEAANYYDFAQRLIERVLNRDSFDMIVYLSIHHAALVNDFGAIDKIRERYSDRKILGPYLYFASWFQGTYDDLSKVYESADAILASKPGDFLTLEMHCIKFEADMVKYPQKMYDVSNVDIIRDFIKKDPRFGFYETTMNDYLESCAHTDGDTKQRLQCIELAISTAEKFDDKKRIANLLFKKARIIQGQDTLQARKLLERAYSISESLGLIADFADIIQELSKLHAIRGEYNRAIKLLLQVTSIRERADLDNSNASLLLSTFYNVIGEPESGLEWGRMAEEHFKSRPNLKPRAYFNQAWSLVLMGKLVEAKILIDIEHESVVKSGDESQLAWLYFVTGILEMTEGDFISAASSVQEALKIYEAQTGAPFVQIIFLHQLAMIEVFSIETKSAITPTLAILEEKALGEDLPGILGQVLLLKAELSILQKDDASLRKIIQELRFLTENESTQFLKPYYDNLLLRV